MLISVIIPAYNSEMTLERCLDSLLTQEHQDTEIIIVNDGSTDSTDQICRRYLDEYPEVKYVYQENAGVSSARNTGLKNALGTYVTFVDSDDYVRSDYFRQLRLQQDVDILFFGMSFTGGKEIQIRIPNGFANGSSDYADVLLDYLSRRDGSTCNKRFLRSVIECHSLQFPEDLYIGEDFVFILSFMLVASSAGTCSATIYCADESGSNSLTRRYRPDASEQALTIYRHAFDLIEASAFDQATQTEMLRIMDYSYCRTAFACVKEVLKGDSHSYFALRGEIQNVLQAFCGQRRHGELTHGPVHFAMSSVIAHNASLIAYLTAVIHGF